jgi:ABC-type multidrug transport system ATPase subunit
MIVFNNVSFSYQKGEKILDNLNLELKPGLVLLVGPNGCGKSTLLRLAAGVEIADSGQILINGLDLWEDEVKSRNQLVYFPEYPDLTPYATIKEVLDLVCRLRGKPIEKGLEALRITGLYHLMKRTVRELSLGQRRRILFSSCMVGDPSVILLDEPLEGMDYQMRKEIVSWVGEHMDDRVTILLACHNFQPFIPMATQAVTIRNGQAVYIETLSSDPQRKRLLVEELAGD